MQIMTKKNAHWYRDLLCLFWLYFAVELLNFLSYGYDKFKPSCLKMIKAVLQFFL